MGGHSQSAVVSKYKLSIYCPICFSLVETKLHEPNHNQGTIALYISNRPERFGSGSFVHNHFFTSVNGRLTVKWFRLVVILDCNCTTQCNQAIRTRLRVQEPQNKDTLKHTCVHTSHP